MFSFVGLTKPCCRCCASPARFSVLVLGEVNTMFTFSPFRVVPLHSTSMWFLLAIFVFFLEVALSVGCALEYFAALVLSVCGLVFFYPKFLGVLLVREGSHSDIHPISLPASPKRACNSYRRCTFIPREWVPLMNRTCLLLFG